MHFVHGLGLGVGLCAFRAHFGELRTRAGVINEDNG